MSAGGTLAIPLLFAIAAIDSLSFIRLSILRRTYFNEAAIQTNKGGVACSNCAGSGAARPALNVSTHCFWPQALFPFRSCGL